MPEGWKAQWPKYDSNKDENKITSEVCDLLSHL